MANTQIYNAETVSNLATVFPRRNEHSYARGSASSLYLNLPGLRAYWPMSANHADADDAYADDISSGYDVKLSETNVQFNNDGVNQMATFVSTGVMTYPNDPQFTITGTESYMAEPGLTVGAWVRWREAAIEAESAILGKTSTLANDRAYWFGKSDSDTASIMLSQTGLVSVYLGATSASAMVAEKWHFVSAIFTPSTSVRVIQDDSFTTHVAGIPASIYASTQDFTIGYFEDDDLWYLDGDLAHVFVCAYALPTVTIKTLYQLTRPLFHGT